jgi:hypothetical protein
VAQAAWIKKGPIQIKALGTLEVLVHQIDPVSVEVTLLDAEEKVVQTLRAEERIARFTMIQPGTYFIFIETNGNNLLYIYHSFARFFLKRNALVDG